MLKIILVILFFFLIVFTVHGLCPAKMGTCLAKSNCIWDQLGSYMRLFFFLMYGINMVLYMVLYMVLICIIYGI